MKVNRRYFFFGCLAMLPGCSRGSLNRGRRPRVSVWKAPDYSIDLETLIRRVLDEHQVDVTAKRVLLKPNLVEFSADRPINTHPVFVQAVAEAFRARGAGEVLIAEGPGHRRTTLDLAEAAGYFEAIPRFEHRFTDLNLDEVRRVNVAVPFSSLRELYLPRTALSADLLVSLPKMKTHHWTGATLSMKNLFGLVPGAVYGWPKNVLHWAGIDECVADLHQLFPRQFCIVDGIEGMEGNGPILGSSIKSGVILAGSYPPGVDEVCCTLMGINPSAVRYLKLVAKRTGRPIGDVDPVGEPVAQLSRNFRLLPELQRFRL